MYTLKSNIIMTKQGQKQKQYKQSSNRNSVIKAGAYFFQHNNKIIILCQESLSHIYLRLLLSFLQYLLNTAEMVYDNLISICKITHTHTHTHKKKSSIFFISKYLFTKFKSFAIELSESIDLFLHQI